MPADSACVEVPPGASEMVRRYHRLERIASGAFALLAAALVAAAVLLLPLLHALAAAVVLLAVVRVPVFRTRGSVRLATGASREAVREDFEGPTPPVLALQWGVADAVRRSDDGAVYDVSYLFGLLSVEMAVTLGEPERTEGRATGEADIEIRITASGRPWATHAVSFDERDGRTTVDVAFASDRRFALRRLPQWLLARRYRDDALAAQGYAVEERDVGLSVR